MSLEDARRYLSSTRLRALLAMIETVFEDASACLFAAQAEIVGVASTVETIEAATGPAGQERLLADTETARMHVNRVAGRFDYLAQTGCELGQQAIDLQRLLSDQAGDLRMASILAIQSRVVSVSVVDHAETLSRFSDTARHLLSHAETIFAELRTTLLKNEEVLKATSLKLQEMHRRALALTEHADRMSALVRRVSEERVIAELAAGTRGAVGATDRALEAAIPRLQAGDTFRQRIEHVAAIVEIADASEKQLGCRLGDLAALQLASAAETVRSEIASTLCAFSDISDHRSACFAQLRDLAASEKMKALVDMSGLARDFVAGLEGLETDRTHLGSGMAAVAARYAEASKKTEELAEIQEQMHLLGVNATLVAGRAGEDGFAMMEIARQLRDATTAIGQRTRMIAEKMHLQQLAAELFNTPGEIPADADSVEAVCVITRHSDNLSDALHRAMQIAQSSGTSEIDEAAKLLTDFVSNEIIRLNPPPTPPRFAIAPEDLRAVDEIRSLYTMASERDLHDYVIGQSPSLIEDSTKPSEDAVLEDVFFA